MHVLFLYFLHGNIVNLTICHTKTVTPFDSGITVYLARQIRYLNSAVAIIAEGSRNLPT